MRYTPPSDKDRKRLVEIAAGVYVEDDVLGIVERIRAYDPNLTVKFLDPNSPHNVMDSPYKIVEKCPDGIERVVMGVWELNEQVIIQLVQADTYRRQKQADMLAELELKNQKAKAAEDAAKLEKDEAIKEMTHDVLVSPKETYTAINPVTGEKHKFRSTPGE